MKVGDKVRVHAGRNSGKVGTVKSISNTSAYISFGGEVMAQDMSMWPDEYYVNLRYVEELNQPDYYYIRNADGQAKAKVKKDIAQKIMDSCAGKFRTAKYITGDKTVFEFTEAVTYGTDEFKVMIWEDDILVSAT